MAQHSPRSLVPSFPALAACLAAGLACTRLATGAEEADLILHGGKIVTVDRDFTIREGLAVRGGRILRVGTRDEVLATKGEGTQVVDLGGKMVLPGLMDSHVHPLDAALYEFDHAVPEMGSVKDVLEHVRSRASALEEGRWIVIQQVFITRLAERRYPSRAELDEVAPKHPVMFRTGPDASLNSLAMKLSGIDRDFRIEDGGPGFIEKDDRGEPTGILRGCTRHVKVLASERKPTFEDRCRRLRELFQDYSSVGITSIGLGSATEEELAVCEALRDRGELTVRVFAQIHVETIGPLEEVLGRIRKVCAHRLRGNDPLLRVGGVKVFLDGGMLTGSAYMRQPWGTSKEYAIDDPAYRGVLFIPRERLLPMARAAAECGLQFTAHSVGDGAVHELLGVYEELSRELPLRDTRPCLTHSNFMSREAVEEYGRLGIVANVQPAWLYLDARTLVSHFGEERLRHFQPLASLFAAGAIVGGGSDHMQKIGPRRSINPYCPFLGIWVAVTRRARGRDAPLHPEERLSREQAIRLYTANDAYLMFQEGWSGSLEEGKLADLIVLDRDILGCPVDEILETRVLRAYLGGRLVHES